MAKHQPADVRRGQILLACMQVCAEKGYYGTRIDDIAERAGLSKGAVYHHFPGGKDEVFLGVLESMFDEMAQLFRDLPPTESPANALRAVVDAVIQMTDAAYPLARGLLEFYLLSVRDPEFRMRFRRHYRGLIDSATELVRRGVDAGELAPGMDPGDVTAAFLMALDGLVLVHVAIEEPKEHAVRALRALTDLVFRSLAMPGRA